MRIRRRPPQISAPVSSDLAAGEGSSAGGGVGESATGDAVGKGGGLVMGTAALHPSIEAGGKGRLPWGGDSAVSWRPGQPRGGGSGGSWTHGGAKASCYGEVHQLLQKDEEEDGVPGAEEESEEVKHQKPGATDPPKVDAHKAWNHIGAGGLHSVDAAANGLGAEELDSSAGAANGIRGALAGAARKRKNIAWSSGSSRLVRLPSSLSLSVKTEISNRGGTSYMYSDDHQLVKDEQEKNGEEQQQVVNGGGNSTGNTNNNSSSKRRRSPAVLMEGSRCSRVNGRGWRCCQQTLVGYSLCEHHLGKGRLRSVSSVRCKKASGAGGKQLPKKADSAEQQPHHKQRQKLASVVVDEEEEEEEEPKPTVGARRRKRIGMVKARSISSLLVQTSPDVVDHAAGAIQEAGATKMVLTAATSVGLPAAVTAPVESSTLATAAAPAVAVSLPPAAHQDGITAQLCSLAPVRIMSVGRSTAFGSTRPGSSVNPLRPSPSIRSALILTRGKLESPPSIPYSFA